MDRINSEHFRRSYHEGDGSDAFLKASKHVQENKEKIKNEWEKRIRVHIPSSEGKSSLVLKNSLGYFLDELVELLAQEDPKIETLTEQGMAKFHGGDRARMSGYFIPQLLQEFSLLRSILNEELHTNGALSFEVRGFLDSAIDAVLSSATSEFTDVQRMEMKNALSQAERSNKELEEFAGVAAHDLKSPLATISGYIALLEQEFGDKLGDEGLSHLRRMESAASRMRHLVDKLLDYARIANHEHHFHRVDTSQAVEAAVQNLSEAMEKEQVRMEKTNLPSVLGDEQLLMQVFQNLISNAIKFRSTQPPHIKISAEDNADTWLFQVQDNGIGFDPSKKDEVFSLYKRLHGAEIQGAGIGLATCRKVIELHGGKIWADSTPGSGSIFYFTVPKQVLH